MKNRLFIKLEKQMDKYKNKQKQKEFIAIKQLKSLNSMNVLIVLLQWAQLNTLIT